MGQSTAFAGGGPAYPAPSAYRFKPAHSLGERLAGPVGLVPFATTVVHFPGLIRYVATGWPYVQAQVLEGKILLLRPLVREGEGEVWVMLQDGREYRFLVRVEEGSFGHTYRF